MNENVVQNLPVTPVADMKRPLGIILLCVIALLKMVERSLHLFKGDFPVVLFDLAVIALFLAAAWGLWKMKDCGRRLFIVAWIAVLTYEAIALAAVWKMVMSASGGSTVGHFIWIGGNALYWVFCVLVLVYSFYAKKYFSQGEIK